MIYNHYQISEEVFEALKNLSIDKTIETNDEELKSTSHLIAVDETMTNFVYVTKNENKEGRISYFIEKHEG